LVIGLLLGAAKCTLFNDPPQAAFTIGPSTAGQAPFEVTLSAALSSDPDGDIETYAWDFGDGTSGAGPSVSHTYTAAGTYTITLVVTDSAGQTDRTSKTVYVTPPEPPGPTASFTASPSSGTSPLTVWFDASASTYEEGQIVSYDWDFGDNSHGNGRIVSHTYFSTGSRTYTVTLTVRGNDGKTATASQAISVTAPGGGGTPSADAPSARFDTDENIGVAPLRVRFDPSESEAAEGKTLSLFVWSFGDGDSASDVSASEKEHVYTTDEPSEVFSVMLLVLDNESNDDSITKTVKVYNHQPVAGFEIANPPGGDIGDPGVVCYADEAAAVAADRWEADDVTYGDLQSLGAFPVDVTVVIRSKRIPDDRWRNLTATAEQKDLDLADGTSAVSSSKPDEPDGYDDHNFSYDPEGQEWATALPTWFDNQAWGIQWLYIDWGDDTAEEQVAYNNNPAVYNGDTVIAHDYTFDGSATSKTITVRAVDYLGAEASFSRTIYLKAGEEGAGDL